MKKVFKAVAVPLKVRAMAVPSTVTLPLEVAAIVPSAMLRVTVRLVLSTSLPVSTMLSPGRVMPEKRTLNRLL